MKTPRAQSETAGLQPGPLDLIAGPRCPPPDGSQRKGQPAGGFWSQVEVGRTPLTFRSTRDPRGDIVPETLRSRACPRGPDVPPSVLDSASPASISPSPPHLEQEAPRPSSQNLEPLHLTAPSVGMSYSEPRPASRWCWPHKALNGPLSLRRQSRATHSSVQLITRCVDSKPPPTTPVCVGPSRSWTL